MKFNDCKTAVIHNGKIFPVRQLTCAGCLDGALIGSESLNDAIMKDGEYTSAEAEQIDLQIVFYVPVSVLNRSNKEIADYVNKNMG